MNIHFEKGIKPSLIARVTGGKLIGEDKPLTGITNDSRCVEPGSMYVAIRGERFDGHDFIEDAFRAGASCVLVDNIKDGIIPLDCCAVLVNDTIYALGAVSKYQKEKVSPYTVAVTGSTGKTTTKEFIYAVLREGGLADKTEGNFNTNIGLPLTMLKVQPGCKYLVLEMGMSFQGEIEYLSHLACPDMAVITNIGDSHIENFGSREKIRDAKLEIRSALKSGGKTILNGDEPLLSGVENGVYVAMHNEKADYYICDIISHDCMCTTFDIIHKGKKTEDITIPVIGDHYVFDAAIAYAVGCELGLDDDKIKAGLRNFKNTGMRQNIYKVKGVTIIDDCYNAAPLSMSASLSVLDMIARREKGRSIAVLGDMRELGDYSRALHEEVGEKVASLKIDRLYTFGADAAFIAHGAKAAGMSEENIFVFRDLDAASSVAEALLADIKEKDAVLFKASRAVKLERVIEQMKEN